METFKEIKKGKNKKKIKGVPPETAQKLIFDMRAEEFGIVFLLAAAIERSISLT